MRIDRQTTLAASVTYGIHLCDTLRVDIRQTPYTAALGNNVIKTHIRFTSGTTVSRPNAQFNNINIELSCR